MGYYVVVLDDGRADIVTVPASENPNAVLENHVVLESYSSLEEAKERCDIENDPVKHGLFVHGDLKVRRPGSN